MTVEEIFSAIAAHMVKGLMIHDKLASGYGFLNLRGYQKCHEYHYYKENYMYRCIYDYYLNTYHKLIPEAPIDNPEVIPDNWYKHVSPDVDANTKRSGVRDFLKKWVDWEKLTKETLEHMYKELYDMGEVCAALKIGKMLKDVSKELDYAECKWMNMESTGYSIENIVAEQDNLCEKYHKKMLCLYDD